MTFLPTAAGHYSEDHLAEQVEFIVLAVPDADPEYLEDTVREFQGNISNGYTILEYYRT